MCARGRYNPDRFYNEVILDLPAVRAALPAAIDAVFYIKDGYDLPDGRPSGRKTLKEREAAARRVHAQLVDAYGDAAPPLLRLNVTDHAAPFDLPCVAPITPPGRPPSLPPSPPCPTANEAGDGWCAHRHMKCASSLKVAEKCALMCSTC